MSEKSQKRSPAIPKAGASDDSLQKTQAQGKGGNSSQKAQQAGKLSIKENGNSKSDSTHKPKASKGSKDFNN